MHAWTPHPLQLSPPRQDQNRCHVPQLSHNLSYCSPRVCADVQAWIPCSSSSHLQLCWAWLHYGTGSRPCSQSPVSTLLTFLLHFVPINLAMLGEGHPAHPLPLVSLTMPQAGMHAGSASLHLHRSAAPSPVCAVQDVNAKCHTLSPACQVGCTAAAGQVLAAASGISL